MNARGSSSNPSGGFRRTLEVIYHRTYSDFFMGSRLGELDELIRRARDRGYDFVTHQRYGELLAGGGVDPERRYLLLRHDIDTDPQTARLMHEVEHRHGIAATFYFRLSTIDVGLMRLLEERGNEASYHYEELATAVKDRGVGAGWQGLLPRAREAFFENLLALRRRSGLPMTTVASHGDFVNRKLGVENTVVLEDAGLRERAGVLLEAYDPRLMDSLSSRHSDEASPRFWRDGRDPLDPIDRGEPVVYILVHPRHWRANPRVNIEDDLRRVKQGAWFRFKIPQRTSARSSL